ncbi:MAG: aspartate aminotransferase family protein [Verrucomicrobiales bacterium]
MKENQDNRRELATAELFERYVLSNYGRFPSILTRGEGAWVWDERGEKHLDFGGGVAVNSLGHCHPSMVAAIREQAEQLIHCSNLYLNRNQALLAEFLCEEIIGRPGKVFFCNSGTEANEALIKLSRKFGRAVPQADGSPRHEILTFENSFHGRTTGALAATAQAKMKEGFEPLMPGFRHLPYNDCNALRSAVRPETAAILVEAVQGEGGVHVASAEFLETISELCREHRILLLMDEVQCGIGRTGDHCGWEAVYPGLEPDAVSWAKGMAGGFPMGAIWISGRALGSCATVEGALSELLGPGTHGATFGGGPLGCAVALAVLREIVGKGLAVHARQEGAFIVKEITAWKSGIIESVRGRGLMLGLVLDEAAVASSAAKQGDGQGLSASIYVVRRLMERGLLSVPAGSGVVRLLPALNTTREESKQALSIIRGLVEDMENAL